MNLGQLDPEASVPLCDAALSTPSHPQGCVEPVPVRRNDAISLHDVLLADGRLVVDAGLGAVPVPALSLRHGFDAAVVEHLRVVVGSAGEDPALEPVTAGR